MILKDIDNKKDRSLFQKAGDSAEKQMAHYLKRAYQDNEDVHVINDLRLVKNDDVAQIDHLIIHRFGFIVIESKSVSTQVSVNDHGEWTRTYNNNKTGMPSPIKQAERQADFLKLFLNENTTQLLKQTRVFKSTMADLKYEVLIAISDKGIIDRPNTLQLAEVHKADQIIDEINAIISAYKKTNKKVLTLKMNRHLADSSMDKIKTFLYESHTAKSIPQIKEAKTSSDIVTEPLNSKSVESSPDTQKNDQEKSCSKCKSKNIAIVYGRFGYYINCLDCNGNTSLNLKCKTNDCIVKLRKDKLNFFQECKTCDLSELYYVNSDLKSS